MADAGHISIPASDAVGRIEMSVTITGARTLALRIKIAAAILRVAVCAASRLIGCRGNVAVNLT